MKSTLKYAFVAENAFVDPKTNKLSALGIFDNIALPKGRKSIALDFVVAGKFYVEDIKSTDRGNLEVKILNPGGTVHRSVILSGDFKKGGDVQFIASFSLVKFDKEGGYEIDLFLNGERPIKDQRVASFSLIKDDV